MFRLLENHPTNKPQRSQLQQKARQPTNARRPTAPAAPTPNQSLQGHEIHNLYLSKKFSARHRFGSYSVVKVPCFTAASGKAIRRHNTKPAHWFL